MVLQASGRTTTTSRARPTAATLSGRAPCPSCKFSNRKYHVCGSQTPWTSSVLLVFLRCYCLTAVAEACTLEDDLKNSSSRIRYKQKMKVMSTTDSDNRLTQSPLSVILGSIRISHIIPHDAGLMDRADVSLLAACRPGPQSPALGQPRHLFAKQHISPAALKAASPLSLAWYRPGTDCEQATGRFPGNLFLNSPSVSTVKFRPQDV